MSFRNLRTRDVRAQRNNIGTTKLYSDIKKGLFPPGAKDGPLSIWAEYEVDAMNAANLAGFSDDEKRGAVQELLKLRAMAGLTYAQRQERILEILSQRNVTLGKDVAA